jgi:MoxR-like ATPase
MYLYLATDAAAYSTNKDATTAVFKPVALMPSTRGRPAKNHTTFEFTDNFSIYIGVVDIAQLSAISQPAELKALIASGGIANILPVTGRRWSGSALISLLGQSLHNLVINLPPAYLAAMPAGVQKQLLAVTAGVANELANIASDPYNFDELVEIIERNSRLLNTVIGNNQHGAGWFYKDETTARNAAATAAAEEKEPESTETTTAEEPDNDMATATVSFGFGKLSGTNGKPELKVANNPANETDVSGVFLPQPDETYIINDQVAQLFKILQISRKNCPQNISLIGPHGCGKTELAIQFAARLGLPLLIMDCANLREARDWFGYKSARDGTVFWHESQFVKAVAAGNHVILLDELNRANPHLLNTLMPLLDARRFTYLEEKGDKICVGPGTVFFASMNEGAGYTGTSALDRAIRDRFPRVVELTYLGEEDEIKLLVKRVGVNEDIASRLVQMANKIRQDATGLSAALTESMSTRQLIAAAHDFAIGGVDTLTFTISNHFSSDGDDDSERVRVQNIIQGKFGDLFAARASRAAAVNKGA